MGDIMSSIVNLPEIKIEYSASPQQKQLVLIGGGRQPKGSWLQQLVVGRKIWCIDHGVDICCQNNLIPELVLGDFDSCQTDSLIWAQKNGASTEQFNSRKDFTDTQAALAKAKEVNAYTILTGALGKRFDHTYSTIFSFGYTGNKGCITDEQETIIFIYPDEEITIIPDFIPKAISLLPVTDTVQGVSTRGLYWELKNAELKQNAPYSVSNELKPGEQKLHIAICNGILAVYILKDEM